MGVRWKGRESTRHGMQEELTVKQILAGGKGAERGRVGAAKRSAQNKGKNEHSNRKNK